MEKRYDVTIVGGGVTGTALLYTLAKYSNLERVLLLEKYSQFSPLNSNSNNNSQTLHFGDIESNYTPEKARKVKTAAEMILKYLNGLSGAERRQISRRCNKMLLAVGEPEITHLERMHEMTTKELFPSMEVLDSESIGRYEPNIMKGRKCNENVSALYSPEGLMVDFGKLSTSLADSAKKTGKTIDTLLSTEVRSTKSNGRDFIVKTNNGDFHSSFVVFAAGGYSLHYAKAMGFGKDVAILSIGGNFYRAPKVLNGKVYRVEMTNVPFAAVHGDPDMNFPDTTRFGPTVTIKPFLEKNNMHTFTDFMGDISRLDTVRSIINVLRNKDIRDVFARNVSYELPVYGKKLFLDREVRKIVPSLGYNDIMRAKGVGGIRPQILDLKEHKLLMGEFKLKEEGLLFNTTPSPGASSCLYSALEDTRYISSSLGASIDEDKVRRDFD